MKLVKLSYFKNERGVIDVIKQSACLAVNPITVDDYAYLLNLHAGGSEFRLYDLNTIYQMVWAGTFSVCFSAHRSAAGGILLLQYSSGVV